MLLLYRQVILLVLLTSIYIQAEAPPGYVKTSDVSEKNPKYEYGYNIEDTKGEGQGKLETREGIYALGRYYVQGSDAKQSVQYYADDWGYHPLVEYSNIGPHSKSRAHLLLGVEAVKALATNKFVAGSVAPSQHVTDSIKKINEDRSGKQIVNLAQSQPQSVLIQQEQLQSVLLQQHQPQSVFIQQEQPQSSRLKQQQEPLQQQIVLQQNQPQVAYLQQQPQHQQNSEAPQLRTQVSTETEDKYRTRVSGYQNVVQHSRNHEEYDESTLTEQNSGGYGARINIKNPAKLIETTKDLVSGQDVLNINEAIDTNIETTTLETSTVKSINEYSSENLVNNVEINNKGSVGITSTTVAPTTEANLNSEPIIVAELQENTVESTEKSATATISISTEPSTVFVTPRPVSTKFLAPITAGIQLQNIESQEEIVNNAEKQNYVIEIQKSLPLYLGKLEYLQNSNIDLTETVLKDIQNRENVQEKAVENLELGKTLLLLPEPLPLIQENKLFIQQLPETNIRENFVDIDQQHAQEVQHQVAIQSPGGDEKVVEKKVPVEVPVTDQKQTVEKIVEKPVPITQIIEKPVHIPQPYPVEKIVEKPVPVEVTRYIDRPYPVQVPVAHPVPYPVDRVVEKIVKQPYPVEVRVPVQVPVPVEKIVEKQVPVPHYIEKPVPYEKIVEKPVPHYIDRPYPVEVKVPVPQPYILNYGVPIKIPILQQQYSGAVLKQQQQQQQQEQQNIYTYITPYIATHSKDYLPPKDAQVNNGYLPPTTTNCDHQHGQSGKNVYYPIKTDDYIGLLPPKIDQHRNYPTKYRNARSNFNTNLRLEYGFMPPLIPSLEIDENGQPIERKEN